MSTFSTCQKEEEEKAGEWVETEDGVGGYGRWGCWQREPEAERKGVQLGNGFRVNPKQRPHPTQTGDSAQKTENTVLLRRM